MNERPDAIQSDHLCALRASVVINPITNNTSRIPARMHFSVSSVPL